MRNEADLHVLPVLGKRAAAERLRVVELADKNEPDESFRSESTYIASIAKRDQNNTGVYILHITHRDIMGRGIFLKAILGKLLFN